MYLRRPILDVGGKTGGPGENYESKLGLETKCTYLVSGCGLELFLGEFLYVIGFPGFQVASTLPEDCASLLDVFLCFKILNENISRYMKRSMCTRRVIPDSHVQKL